MAFDWRSFLDKHRIRYIEFGKNVKRGNINIHCPFCGPADPSEHMGLNLQTGEWGCWRNETHRGEKPHRLICTLAHLTWDEAKILVDDGIGVLGTELLKEKASVLFAERKKRITLIEEQVFPSDFKPIVPEGLRSRFFNYLYGRDRCFLKEHVPLLCRCYKLQCALSGRFSQRVIIPFLFGGRVVGWTGRAIGDAELRYDSFPENESVKQIVFNYDRALAGGRMLFIVEGPFDALKVDFYGKGLGVRAVSLLGTSALDPQINLLLDLGERFDEVVIMLDADAMQQALRLQSKLALIKPKFKLCPQKDPGGMKPHLIESLLLEILK